MEEFRSWHERGLIYRGYRVVNWDVKFQSAVSDIEVETQERKGKLYHFKYPFADESDFITIATTRPKTLLGDALDIGKETERIEKELTAIAKQIERAEGMLSNLSFVERATPEKVEEERKRLADWQEKQTKIISRRLQLF